MANTIQLSIKTTDEQVREQLIAKLAEVGFEGFEETDQSLEAFISEQEYNESSINSIVNSLQLQFTSTVVPDQNWNELWESNFHPVLVENFCGIRADFHPPFIGMKHEIVITPKMSFGTGHHATTYMMVREMGKINFENKKVADFGTGTGVLAILAEQLGARSVWAIDYDDWSIENASENIVRNNCKNIQLEKKDTFKTDFQFDVILANINRNVILDNVSGIFGGLKNRSNLLLSGLLTTDEKDIINAFKAYGLKHISTVERNNWICILMEMQD